MVTGTLQITIILFGTFRFQTQFFFFYKRQTDLIVPANVFLKCLQCMLLVVDTKFDGFSTCINHCVNLPYFARMSFRRETAVGPSIWSGEIRFSTVNWKITRTPV